MAVWKLQHRETYPQKPYLFYVAFADQETVNKLEESHIIHADLEIAALPAQHFRSGSCWQELLEQKPELARRIEAAPLAVTLHGSIISHESLDYLRDSLELITSLVEHGACAVFDPVAQCWHSSEAWLNQVSDGALFNPFDHVVILKTPSSDGKLHFCTRGLRKFGRPDLIIEELSETEEDIAGKVLDRFINHLCLGGVIEHDREIAIDGWSGSFQAGPVQGGPEDPKFHNSFVALVKQSAKP